MKFYFMDAEIKNIQEKKFFCIYVYEPSKHIIFKIYKIYDDELANRLKNFKLFNDVSHLITFVIKRDGKIALDIKLQN